MANKWAVANGKWSDTATWKGGTLPSAGDYVYANGYTVEIDQDITVGTISTEVCPDTNTGGGGFTLAGAYIGSRYIIANIKAGTSTCLTATYAYTLLHIIGDITGGSVANAYGYYNSVTTYGASGLSTIVVGNITGGSGENSCGFQTRTDRSYSATITGNITASANSIGMRISYSSSTVNIVGNITSVNGHAGFNGQQGGRNLYATGIFTSSVPASGWAIYTTGSLYLSGVGVCSSSGNMPFFHSSNCSVFIQTGGDFTLTMATEDSSTKTLYTDLDQPDESDVRAGVKYGLGVYEGTCIIPPVESVVKNVPVDDTVGTYELTPEVIEHITELQNPKKVLGSGIIAYQ